MVHTNHCTQTTALYNNQTQILQTLMTFVNALLLGTIIVCSCLYIYTLKTIIIIIIIQYTIIIVHYYNHDIILEESSLMCDSLVPRPSRSVTY